MSVSETCLVEEPLPRRELDQRQGGTCSQFSDKISGSALMRDFPYWTVTPVRARAVSFVYTVQSELSGDWHAVDSKC